MNCTRLQHGGAVDVRLRGAIPPGDARLAWLIIISIFIPMIIV